MSVIACKVVGDGFEIASDSIMVRGYTQTIDNVDRAKMVEVDENIVLGAVGSLEETVLFQMFLKTHKPSRNDEEAILELLVEFTDWRRSKTDYGNIQNQYIMGIDNLAYHIEGFGVSRITSFEAIGAGMDYALTALALEHSVKEAVQVAIDLSIYCEYPIVEIKKGGK